VRLRAEPYGRHHRRDVGGSDGLLRTRKEVEIESIRKKRRRWRSNPSGKEVEIESIRKKLARAADTGYRMWHNA